MTTSSDQLVEEEVPYVSSDAYDRGIFGSGANLEARYIEDFEVLERKVEACKELGLCVVLTSGTFDIIHIGHARYLEKARTYGDVLVVGVDSDEKVKERKGPNRPVVPEAERVAMLSHLRDVDMIALKTLGHAHWELIRRVKPDVLIATEGTYTDEEKDQLKEFCGEVIVLEPQAETSTTAKIRRLHIDFASRLQEGVSDLIKNLIEND